MALVTNGTIGKETKDGEDDGANARTRTPLAPKDDGEVKEGKAAAAAAKKDDDTPRGKGGGSLRVCRRCGGKAWRQAWRNTARGLERYFVFALQLFKYFMKVLGICLICVALGLVSHVTYTFFEYAMPLMAEEGAGAAKRYSIVATGVFLLSNMLWNYGNAICSDPGKPPEWDEEKEALRKAETQELAEPRPKQCGKCQRLKPQRTHHCSVCDRCVLKMDHHCPWVNNCVGFGNYRYFCLFLLYLACCCCFVVIVFFRPFAENMFYRRRGAMRGSRDARQAIMTGFMISCSVLVALCILGGFHVFLVLTNQTTIEFQTNLMRRREARKNGEFFRNPFDLGRSRNFQQVFGPNAFCRFYWLLSYLSPGPDGNGLEFPSLSRLKF